MALRDATEADIETLTHFVKDYHLFDHIPFEEEATRKILGTLLGNPKLGRLWIIELEGNPAGYAVMTFSYSIEYLGRNAFLDELYLTPPFRGKGIGRQVLEELKSHAKNLGIKALHLEAERQNQRAITLYTKLNFQNPDRVLMTCWLN